MGHCQGNSNVLLVMKHIGANISKGIFWTLTTSCARNFCSKSLKLDTKVVDQIPQEPFGFVFWYFENWTIQNLQKMRFSAIS